MLLDRNGDEIKVGDTISVYNPRAGTMEDAKIDGIFDHATGSIWITPLGGTNRKMTICFAGDAVKRVAAARTKPVSYAASGAVNDSICSRCKNDRVSKTEKSCWRCGENL